MLWHCYRAGEARGCYFVEGSSRRIPWRGDGQLQPVECPVFGERVSREIGRCDENTVMCALSDPHCVQLPYQLNTNLVGGCVVLSFDYVLCLDPENVSTDCNQVTAAISCLSGQMYVEAHGSKNVSDKLLEFPMRNLED